MKLSTILNAGRTLNIVAVFSFFLVLMFAEQVHGQVPEQPGGFGASRDQAASEDPENGLFDVHRDFRVEKIHVQNGAEIVTIFANLKGFGNSEGVAAEVPLISILRDTLGDDKVENDRLRYVWVLTYTKPSLAQKFAAFVPFLYFRTTNKNRVGNGPPPAVIDVNPSRKAIWDKILWNTFRNLILEDLSFPVKAATVQYKTNVVNYRKSAIARALAVLSLFEEVEGEKVLTDSELNDIQARLLLTNRTFGSFMQSENLQRFYQTRTVKALDIRGRNWELLRQRSEEQGLYFEPLEMTKGDPTHALVWVSALDLIKNKDRKFDSRFLNIRNPWNDARLANWNGYSETRWFDKENRLVSPESPDSVPRKMIPLGLYGLDNPKIPTLLIDFRDRENPKKREISKRILDDLTRNVLSVSKFNNLSYFVGRYLLDFVTGRRGMDLNRQSRVSSYSQLKLLLSLNASLDPNFREEIADRLERVSVNPLENDLANEINVARQQYKNLIDYARNPDGLAAKIEKDRMGEMIALKHGSAKRLVLTLGRVLSFGLYRHSEKVTPELLSQMDISRQLDFHERFLKEVARVSVDPAIDNDLQSVNRSLSFIGMNGTDAQAKTAKAIAKIFTMTESEETRLLCLSGLLRINNSTAKRELLGFYNNQNVELRWRNLCAKYLKLAVKEDQRISQQDIITINKIGLDD